jgi:hypothetical protein
MTKKDDKTYFPWGDTAMYPINGNDPPRPPNEFEKMMLEALKELLGCKNG